MTAKTIVITGADEVTAALASIGKRQAVKAATLWTNSLGLESQGEMRRTIGQRFSFRGTTDGFRKAVVFQEAKASGDRAQKAVLKVGGPGFGQSRTQKLGAVLARHEEANTRTKAPTGGLADLVRLSGNRLAPVGGYFMPANGMRTSTQNPPASMYPRAIGVQMRADPSGAMSFAKGTKKGSKKSGNGVSYFATEQGIFRRRHTGFGRADVQAIWWFRRTIRTPARLGLWETAEEVMQRRAIALGLQAIEETIFREWVADSQKGAPRRLL